MLIRQNFSFECGADMTISVDIDPDDASLVGTQLTFRMYEQMAAIPTGDPVITKDLDDGLTITDPDYGELLITFARADTADLVPKNYWFEISLDDLDDNHVPVAQGIATGTRTMNPVIEA